MSNDKVARSTVRYGQIDREYGMKLATTPADEDGPIWMVNLMSYRDKADYADGRESDISGKEADDRYASLVHRDAVAQGLQGTACSQGGWHGRNYRRWLPAAAGSHTPGRCTGLGRRATSPDG